MPTWAEYAHELKKEKKEMSSFQRYGIVGYGLGCGLSLVYFAHNAKMTGNDSWQSCVKETVFSICVGCLCATIGCLCASIDPDHLFPYLLGSTVAGVAIGKLLYWNSQSVTTLN